MKIVIGLIAIAFFGYWFYSVTTIGEPKGFYCESVMGDKIVILPIRGDSCQIQVEDTLGKIYAIPVKWSWRITGTVLLNASRERIAFLEPDGMIYFYTDIESVKQPINEIHYQPN